MLAVDRQSGGLFAWRQGPVRFHLKLLRIDRIQLALVFDIDENLALAIANGKLRLSFQFYSPHHHSAGAIDRSRVVAAAIEGEYSFSRGIIQNGVGVVACFNLADRLQGLHVKDRDSALAAVADETAS